uniref:Uncharacterized protein n=1 Tax=uncultured marine virus TaxID=186617 RepID=A0A0F7LAF4_9VIRU|nr:hypothetical protein [uncultured marine virus]
MLHLVDLMLRYKFLLLMPYYFLIIYLRLICLSFSKANISASVFSSLVSKP